MYYLTIILSAFLCLVSSLHAENLSAPPIEKKVDPKDELIETSHSININGEVLKYRATTGTLPLKDQQGKLKANIFYIAYTKADEPPGQRPITFCFNGGPGSSAVWLHLGVLGPKKVIVNEEGCIAPPYRIEDNPSTLLQVSDLVFIDPVSTGFSRPAPGEDAKQFHGVEEDIRWIGEFIRLYTTRFQRWGSPKFLAGESYGTTRAAGLVDELHSEHYLFFNGVILISSVLDFQTIQETTGNDLPYLLALPSYAATAWYHEKLSKEMLSLELPELLKKAEKFALNEYSIALLKGDQIDRDEKRAIVSQLAQLTGLSEKYIEKSNLRLSYTRFAKELLRDDDRTLGRFDSRIKGFESDLTCSDICNYDPSLDAISGGFTAAFNDYIQRELKWNKDDEYMILTNVWPWNYGRPGSNKFLNVADTLAQVMAKNPHLKIFVASGYYDLATPYFATDYTFHHLVDEPSMKERISLNYYEGGHMMYTLQPTLMKLNQDLSDFVISTCKPEKD